MGLTAFLAAKNSHLFHLVLFCDKIGFDITQPFYVTIFLFLIQEQFHIKLKPIYQNH